MPVISTNTASNSANRYLAVNSSAQSSSVSKLASGSRITSASDDAAGLAVATSLNSDITVLKQASTNASNAQSILESADGTLSNIAEILQRMRSLATQAISGTVTDDERDYLDAEYQQLSTEITAIAQGTRFNDVSLLSGDASGTDSGSDTAWKTGITVRVGTTSNDNITITIDTTNASTLGGYTDAATGNTYQVGGGSANTTDVQSSTTASIALETLNMAVTQVSATRSDVGAMISRFEYREATLDTSVENTEAAQSAILDVDVAEEQTTLSTEKVKTQAAIAVLSQANSMPEDLLSLLR